MYEAEFDEDGRLLIKTPLVSVPLGQPVLARPTEKKPVKIVPVSGAGLMGPKVAAKMVEMRDELLRRKREREAAAGIQAE